MQVVQLTRDNQKLGEENARLQAALGKANKEAHNKVELYKNKTEQFQAQWKKRQDAEQMLKVPMFVIKYVVFYY